MILPAHEIFCSSDSSGMSKLFKVRVKKIELENIIEYKTKGAIIRSKARWYNEGEKNNKYFLNLENRHCKKDNYADQDKRWSVA